MSSTKFILRLGKKKSDREYPVYLQYKHFEGKVLIATGKKCEPRSWDKKQGKPKNDESLAEWLNTFKKRFNKNAVNSIEGEPEAYKVKETWKEYLQNEKKNLPEAVFKNSLLARWEDYINYQKETLTPGGKERTAGTIRNNTNSRKQLENFLVEKNRVSLRPEKFTLSDFQKFDAYLVKNLSPNSVSKVKKHFKSFLKWHIKNGGLLGFNISFIEYAETAGVKISLTEKELTTIAQANFKGLSNLYRDLMVLQASTGVRVSDLQRLCDNINEDKTAFKIKVKKTGKYILIPVLPLAKEVLERHNYKLPIALEQKYRQGIKDIYKELWPKKSIEIGQGDKQKKVFVWEEISSHDMVRTFVDISAKKGISVPTIATITGKSIQVLLKNYLSEDKEHAAQELLEKFDLSPLRIAK